MSRKLYQQFKQSIYELINGRKIPSQTTPTRVTVVEIQALKNQIHSKTVAEKPFPDQENLKTDDVIVIPNDNPMALKQFADLHTDLVFRYILKRVGTAISRDMPSINLFRFGKKVAKIERHNYDEQLQKMMRFFVNTENYELAAKCRDLLDRHTRNEIQRFL